MAGKKHRFKNSVVVFKESLLSQMKGKKVDQNIIKSHIEQVKSLETVKRLLPNAKYICLTCLKHPIHADLCITVGGDGTLIRASHFVKDHTLFLAMNSDVKRSEGSLTVCNRMDFSKKLKRVFEGKFKIIPCTRLKVSINNKSLNVLALNEVFFGHKYSWKTVRYLFNKEEHKDSGLIISTGTGSTGWYASIGGKPFAKDAGYGKFLMRES